MARVRTNIEIEDDYVRAVMDRYGVRTKTEAVDLALRHLVGQPMTRTAGRPVELDPGGRVREDHADRGGTSVERSPIACAPRMATASSPLNAA